MNRNTVGALMVIVPAVGGTVAMYVMLFLMDPAAASTAILVTIWMGIGLYLMTTP